MVRKATCNLNSIVTWDLLYRTWSAIEDKLTVLISTGVNSYIELLS
jgi:hypothetical protein